MHVGRAELTVPDFVHLEEPTRRHDIPVALLKAAPLYRVETLEHVAVGRLVEVRVVVQQGRHEGACGVATDDKAVA